MNRRYATFTIALLVALLSACVTVVQEEGFVLERGETLRGDLVLRSSQAVLESEARVTGSATIINGDLRLEPGALVQQDVILFLGDLQLLPGSEVGGDVLVFAGKINQESGAQVGGKITSNLTNFFRTLILQLFFLVCVLPLVLALVVYLALKWWQRRQGTYGFDLDLIQDPIMETAPSPLPED